MIPLLGVEIDNNTLMGAGGAGFLGIIGLLLALDRKAKNYIHDAINQKPPGREILGQPVRVALDEKVMTEKAHQAVCGSLHQRVGVLENDVRSIRIKMDADKSEIIDAGEDRAVKIHDRINVAIEKIGELKGQVTEIAKRVK